MDDQSKLFQKLKRGPAILFLGQEYLKLQNEVDPFLKDIVQKYCDGYPEKLNYDSILDNTIAQLNIVEDALSWMQERCDRIEISSWVQIIGDFSWNSVFTSCIDSVILRILRNEWRECHGIYNEEFRPEDYRSRIRLHSTFLYGNVNRSASAERPPFTRIEKIKRKQVATLLLNRIPELVTPLGLLIVEGYDVHHDWVSMEDWLPVIEKVDAKQVHFFSVKIDFYENSLFNYLVENKRIIPHNESLAEFLKRGEELGFFKLGVRPDALDEKAKYVTIKNNPCLIPKDIFSNVVQAAMILDDNILTKPRRLSKDRLYSEFRNFLAECSNRMMWEGYVRGFNFRRDYEVRLKKEVDKLLKSSQLDNKILLLHGQTGSGKTIALGALAVKIKKERRAPVLFIERKYENLSYEHIDTFCDWAEEMGADRTLIVWDGMRHEDSYLDLNSHLVARGRKVVIVGSFYKVPQEKRKKLDGSFKFVEATPKLSSFEISRLLGFLDNYDEDLGRVIRRGVSNFGNNFLVALYRLLPSTRNMIRRGMSAELSHTEKIMKKISKKLGSGFAQFGNLGYEMFKAGIIQEEALLGDKKIKIDGDLVSEMEQLTGLVMVPGRCGLKVPLELLIRSLEKNYSPQVASLFEESDIFQFSEDFKGNIFIHPRHSLEARLIVQAKFGSIKSEIEFIKKLIFKIKDELGERSNIEIDFIIDLLKYVGPNSDEANRFSPFYCEIYSELKKLRKERNIYNPRLMLQEAYFMREYIKQYDNMTIKEKNDVLTEARDLLEEALKLLRNGGKSKLKSVLLSELASNLGAKLHNEIINVNSIEYKKIYCEIKNILNKAQNIEPDDYHSIDILAWTTRELLQATHIDEVFKIEAEANILFAFERAEAENFEMLQKQKFEERKMEIAHLLKKAEMEEEAFERLIKQNSKAGIFLRAKRIVADVPFINALSKEQIKKCEQAVKYLMESDKTYGLDGRCLYLLLRLFWMKTSGKPIFFKERQTVPFSKSDWDFMLELINRLHLAGEEFVTAPLMYLKGLTSFHLGLFDESFSAFKELKDILAYGKRRVIKSHLSANEKGDPIRYNGTVNWISADGFKGELYVEEIRRKVDFFPKEFNLQNTSIYESINDFHIAFNFLGPKADPSRKVRRS